MRLALVAALVLLLAPAPGVAAEPDFAAAIRAAVARYPSEEARLAVGDAFLRFESSPLDAELKMREPARYRDLEVQWLALGAAMRSGAPTDEVRERGRALAALLEQTSAAGPRAGATSLFVDALLIIVREGFEAILILTALAAYLVKVGQPEKRALLWAGGGAAVVASVALGALAGRLLPLDGVAREALEGVTMLLAVVVLFAASYWLISKAEARHWQAFVRSRLEGALGTGRSRSLVVLAFLVVFREGVETVLFYEALVGRAAADALALSAVAAGLALGVLALIAIAFALFRYGVRIPIRPFFAVTGALLYLLAIKFAGAGVRELQEAGLLGATPVAIPESAFLRDWLAVYPLLEPLLAQAVLVLALLAGGAYAAFVRPRASGGADAALHRPHAARP
jgi:high-affinity iron transporter